MSWARLDDEILDNPKIALIGPLGFALHVAGITWCARNLTDGFIPERRVESLLPFNGCVTHPDTPDGLMALPDGDAQRFSRTSALDVAECLRLAGLWHPEEHGYRIHDYLDYNPSRAEVLAERAAAREQRVEAGKGRARTGLRERGKYVKQPAGGPAGEPAESQRATSPVPVPVPVPVYIHTPPTARARTREAYPQATVETVDNVPDTGAQPSAEDGEPFGPGAEVLSPYASTYLSQCSAAGMMPGNVVDVVHYASEIALIPQADVGVIHQAIRAMVDRGGPPRGLKFDYNRLIVARQPVQAVARAPTRMQVVRERLIAEARELNWRADDDEPRVADTASENLNLLAGPGGAARARPEWGGGDRHLA